jgi:hypothetical protein
VKEPFMTRALALIASTIVVLCVVACEAEQDSLLGGVPGPGGPGSDPGTAPGTCAASPHVGFGRTDFAADRTAGEIGTDRRRVKPYSALGTEFKRALSQAPAALASNAAAFGEAPARWFIEPGEGAVSLYTTYTLAFTTCYDTMTGDGFTAAPTAATATAECAKMQRKFWQRTATPDETKACADLVLDLTTETVPRRRWAHGCASILASTEFTTY